MELNILTYNVKFLPAILLSQHHHPIVRAKYIPQALFGDSVDVIIFEEAFDGTARRALIRLLRRVYPYVAGPANNKAGFKVSSGVFIASKYPMKELGQIQFDQCYSYDCMARKGALLCEIITPDNRAIQVLGTHIQAPGDDSIKISQFRQIRSLMDAHYRSGVPQLACGDFNTCRADQKLYDTLLTTLQVTDGPITGEQQTSSDHLHNDMEHYSTEQNLVDYLLYRAIGLPAPYTERRIIKYQYQWHKHHKDLSDHYGVKLNLIY
jgi:endonuclease/exonuclease/phosphatase family metal-dependent hydrolase